MPDKRHQAATGQLADTLRQVDSNTCAGLLELLQQRLDDYTLSEDDYVDMLRSLESAIHGRVETGRW